LSPTSEVAASLLLERYVEPLGGKLEILTQFEDTEINPTG